MFTNITLHISALNNFIIDKFLIRICLYYLTKYLWLLLPKPMWDKLEISSMPFHYNQAFNTMIPVLRLDHKQDVPWFIIIPAR